jgi:hypothetical protein
VIHDIIAMCIYLILTFIRLNIQEHLSRCAGNHKFHLGPHKLPRIYDITLIDHSIHSSASESGPTLCPTSILLMTFPYKRVVEVGIHCWQLQARGRFIIDPYNILILEGNISDGLATFGRHSRALYT